MKSTRTIATAAAAAFAVALAATTFAQPFGGPGGGSGPGHARFSAAERQAFMDARFAEIKTQIGITSAQESAWQNFVAKAQAQHQSMEAARTQMWSTAASAPERAAQHVQLMEQRLDGMAASADALKALYDVLTPAQRTIADQTLGMMGTRGKRSGRGF